ncbi:MAG: SDR family NAD(P)-dependent oxidoreductase [Capsulimonadales bacterium]|nr:SDR family NAD(P)-dependent oxidoreductase [Capsulimonadales bacterium]
MTTLPEQARVALITGASSGIGAAFARALAARRYDLILVARRAERLGELAAECHDRYGVRADVQVADLSRTDDIERIASLAHTYDNVSLLVNNAGFGTSGRFVDVDVRKSVDMITVHVTATMQLTHAFLPRMIARDEGAILNVSTIVSDIAQAGTAVYCATKSFVNSFSRSLQREMDEAGRNIQVRTILPGLTETEFFSTDEYRNRGIAQENRRFVRSAEEVAEASLASLSSDHVYVFPDATNRRVYELLVREGKTWPEAVAAAYDEAGL